ncbi:MAG: STAS domain-containing protein [Calditrichae bacterium]|nr:STAS domain-containing protein [Calditrichota bacterium]MCB9059554.1 STAS domain-containing protein [Calditrichia bacterium]
MQIDVNSVSSVYVVRAKGKLMSPVEVEELTSYFRYLRDKKVTRTVLNLQEMDWMGSIGLGALISCVTTMRNAGGDVHLCNLNEKLRSIMKITRLDQVFAIFDSEELAVQNYSAVAH